MPHYNVGQIVELDATGFGPGALLRTGDRGTVIAPGRVDEFRAMVYGVLWHKDGREHDMVEDRLRIFTHPMDKPGRAKGALATMEALRAVLQEEQPRAISEVLRELERARMTAEDWRGAMVSPYDTLHDMLDSRYRRLSWREFGRERNKMCDHLVYEVMEPAENVLMRARRQIRLCWQDPQADYESALTAAYNAMCDAERHLRDQSDDDESGEVSGDSDGD